ncbi:MAG: hypothetical protein LBC83_02040 [Oscillospiraceae bacterium]|nr:hypothetical protein [Oscillospiraceae bacterium]
MSKPHKKRLRWGALLLALLLALGFAACTKRSEGKSTASDPGAQPVAGDESRGDPNLSAMEATTAPNYAWRIAVRGANISEFTSNDAKFCQTVTNLAMTVTDAAYGIATTRTYTGITLRSLLGFVGVPAEKVQSVTVRSVTGQSVVYPADLALDSGTLLAWEMDGLPLESSPPLKMCAKKGAVTDYVEVCASISIVTLAPGQTAPVQPETLPDGTPVPTQPGTTTRNRWTLGTVTYPTLDSGHLPIPTMTRPITGRPATRTTAKPSQIIPTAGTTAPVLPTAGTTKSGTGVAPTATGNTGTGTTTTRTETVTTVTTTTSGRYSYTTRPATAKPSTAPSTAATTATTTTTVRTTHTYPAWVDGAADMSRYDEGYGLEPNYPPDY